MDNNRTQTLTALRIAKHFLSFFVVIVVTITLLSTYYLAKDNIGTIPGLIAPGLLLSLGYLVFVVLHKAINRLI